MSLEVIVCMKKAVSVLGMNRMARTCGLFASLLGYILSAESSHLSAQGSPQEQLLYSQAPYCRPDSIETMNSDSAEFQQRICNSILSFYSGNERQTVGQLRDLLAEFIQRSGGEFEGTINLRGQLAGALLLSGDLDEAARLLELNILLSLQEFPDDKDEVRFWQTELVRVLQRQGRDKEALDFVNSLIEAYEAERDDLSAVLLGGAKAGILSDMGRYPEAIPFAWTYLDRALTDLGDCNPNTGHAFLGLAEAAQKDATMEERMDLLSRAVDSFVCVFGPDDPITMLAYHRLAVLLQEGDQGDIAMSLANALVEQSEKHWGLEHPNTVAFLETRYNILWRNNELKAALEDARIVVENGGGLERDSIYSESYFSRPWDTGIAQNGQDLARLYWDVAQATHSTSFGTGGSASFEAAQLGASGAAEAVNRASAKVVAGRAGLQGAVGAWEEALGDSSALNTRFVEVASARIPSTELLADLVANRERVVQRIAAAEDRLRSEFPRYFDLVAPAPVTVAELQGSAVDEAGKAQPPLLTPEEAVVLISPPEDDAPGLVWAVSRERVAWAEISLGEEELDQRLSRLHAMLDGGDRGAFPMNTDRTGFPVPGFDRQFAYALYRDLLGDPEIQAVLAEKPDWILAPQGALLSLPFAALVTEEPSGGMAGDADPRMLRETRWLGLERALAVVPAVSSVRSLRRFGREGAGRADRPFFGLGDPDFDGDPGNDRSVLAADFFRTPMADIENVRHLPRLPGTLREIEAFLGYFNLDRDAVLLGRAATETNLAAAGSGGAMSHAKVVVLATHGLLAGAFDGLTEPALALTPPRCRPVPIGVAEGLEGLDTAPVPDGANCPVVDPTWARKLNSAAASGAWIDDGLLTASEAARLDLDADWVILSACDTASGAEQSPDAEGLSGLARAFFYAGARSLLVSHWPVRDDVAARLTTDAVARANEGLTRPRAFRAAMRALMEDTSQDTSGLSLAHPAAWAPFQVTGVDAMSEER